MKRNNILRKHLFTWMLVLATAIQLHAQQISFPGAEGAGKFASGGRGTASILTTVFEVTNLTDVNSVGSLRYACSQSTTTYPYRTIVFRVSGTIHLNSKLSIPKNTTVAGQTAPGDGICLADYPVGINGDNVIVRYIRFRMGDKNQLKTSPANCGVPVAPFTPSCMPIDGSGGDDSFGDLGHKNLIIDHCSVSWSNDEAMTFYRGDSLTLQWNFITEPLNYSYHFETGDTDFEHHGYGGIWGALHGTFHHNLFAHCQSRNPRFGGNNTYASGQIESADFRNNVIYNWGNLTVYGGEGGQYNLVNNYYKFGPSTGASTKYRIVNVDSNTSFTLAKYYLSGNYVDGSTTNTNNNWSGAYMMTGNAADTVRSKVTTPYLVSYLPTTTDAALVAYDTVLKSAGAILPKRDTLDQRIVNDVKFRIGRFIDVQGGYQHGTPYATTVNAWPTLNSETAPVDSDNDGMPDTWEIANGLNPNNALDRGVFAANGYTNLENYLNSITATTQPAVITNTANATWTLLADQTPNIVGNLTGTNQSFGSYLSGTQYGSTFGTISGWQRAANTSFLPIGYNANSYIEYKLTPAPGKKFTATSIELSALGGGTSSARMLLYYSLDNFATSLPVGATTYNNITYAGTDTLTSVALLNTSTTILTGQQVANAPTFINVLPSQTLSVRVYVWITGSGNRYFPSQNMKIDGVTSDMVVPLSLISFSAIANNYTTLLWKTSDETNMKSFEVERSNDGQNFAFVGNINAKNISTTNSYSFVDNTPLKGTIYYRLKMINTDGSFRYSYTITINKKLSSKISIFPNPVINTVTLTHEAVGNNAVVTLLNMEGRKMKTISITRGTTQTSFQLSHLPSSLYLLQLVDDKGIETIKFLKK